MPSLSILSTDRPGWMLGQMLILPQIFAGSDMFVDQQVEGDFQRAFPPEESRENMKKMKLFPFKARPLI